MNFKYNGKSCFDKDLIKKRIPKKDLIQTFVVFNFKKIMDWNKMIQWKSLKSKKILEDMKNNCTNSIAHSLHTNLMH